jgi:tRNA nucleotidyltransferase (CCA-adding enzyme)
MSIKLIKDVAEEVHAIGGTLYITGGHVRDNCPNNPKDIDAEVHNVTPEQLVAILSSVGEVDFIGKSFGTYMVKGYDVDFALPRKESRFGPGHKDFDVTVVPDLGVEEAARRRDFTVNATYMNPLTAEILDPFNGIEDMDKRILRVVDPKTFVEDPLRVLRGAQFCARYGLTADKQTIRLCRRIKDEYSSIPKERVFEELKKLLLKGKYPSLGIQFLRDTRWLENWPELDSLWGVPQDPKHHPEGHVGKHVLEVIDRAVGIKKYYLDRLFDLGGTKEELIYMLAALLHDVGKYTHTYYRTEPKHLTHWKKKRPNDSRIVSYGHDSAGEEVARQFLERITEDTDILRDVPKLVKYHMKPLLMNGASDKAFRRLAKQGCDMRAVAYLSWADKGQRPTDWFDAIERLTLHGPKENCVSGHKLIGMGLIPGPKVGEIIRQCEDIFIKTGITDQDVLIERVMGKKRR